MDQSTSNKSLRAKALDMVAEGLARPKEAGKYLAYSLSYIYILMDDGRLPFVGTGRARRIPWKAVHAYAAENLCTTGRNGPPRKRKAARPEAEGGGAGPRAAAPAPACVI